SMRSAHSVSPPYDGIFFALRIDASGGVSEKVTSVCQRLL
ncbi:MAG: hypothetical protein RLZ84_549, partial [Actinomycetota bacterium]